MEKVFPIGHEAQINVSFKDLVANVAVVYKGADGVEATLNVKLPAQAYLEKLKKLIPGQIDDMVIDLAAQAAKLL